jgi:cytochrome c
LIEDGQSPHHFAPLRNGNDVELADHSFKQKREEVAMMKTLDFRTTAHRMEITASKAMSWVVPGLTLAAFVSASTAAILSKAEAAGNAAAGEQIFIRCTVCHSPKAGENKIGPSLAGVYGRKSGSVPGYNYSPALKSAGITWDEQSLDKFLTNPAADVHGTKMVISIPNTEDRQNLIAYLMTLK